MEVTDQLVPGPPLERPRDDAELVLAMQVRDDFDGVQSPEESPHLGQSVALVIADKCVEAIPLRARAIEELDRGFRRFVLEPDVGNALEERLCVARKLVEPGGPRRVDGLDPDVLRTNLRVLMDAEIAYPLHEITDWRARRRKLARKEIDVLRERVHEETRAEDGCSKEQALVVLPAVPRGEAIEELDEGTGTRASRSNPGAFAERTEEIGIAESVIGTGQPMGTREPSGAEHCIEDFRIRRCGVAPARCLRGPFVSVRVGSGGCRALRIGLSSSFVGS